MAGLNGMGPFEEGARTGRGLGRCNNNDNYNRKNERGTFRGRGLKNRYGFNCGRGFRMRRTYNEFQEKNHENYDSLVQERDLLQQKLKFIEDGLKKLGSGQD